MALRVILHGVANKATADELRYMFQDVDSLERLQLSPLHQIVLGIKKGDIETQIRRFPSQLNVGDSDGKTSLSWAASKGDPDILRRLLRCGADPNIPNIAHQMPLHFAAQANNPGCIEPLIKAGAMMDSTNVWGLTPLHDAAITRDDPRFLEPLIFAGANPNSRTGNNKASPLARACGRNNVKNVTFLIDHGASVDDPCRIIEDDTPLNVAIRYNAHECLNVLLQRGATHTDIFAGGDSIMHVAARYADVCTIQILADCRFEGLDPELKNKEGDTPPDLLRARMDACQELDAAYWRLVDNLSHNITFSVHSLSSDGSSIYNDCVETL